MKTLIHPTLETKFPASVSIADLLKAGKLVKPPKKNKVKLTFEKFDVQNQEWQEVMEQDVVIETQMFSSGAFRDAFRATSKTDGTQKQWVVKTYNPKAVEAIVVKLSSTIDDHARKQLQMHAVARHLAQKFALTLLFSITLDIMICQYKHKSFLGKLGNRHIISDKHILHIPHSSAP